MRLIKHNAPVTDHQFHQQHLQKNQPSTITIYQIDACFFHQKETQEFNEF